MKKQDQSKSGKERQNGKKKNGIQYRIFRVDTDEKTGKEKKITMVKFFAKDDKAAYEELKKYRRLANKIYKYYYERVGKYTKKDDNGNVVEFDSFMEMMEYGTKSHWYDFIGDFLYWLSYLKYRIRLAWQRATKGHSDVEVIGLLGHILDDLEYNLPKLAEECEHPVMTFVVEARAQLHKDEKGFDLQKSLDNDPNFTDEEMNLGSELMRKTILGLLEDIRAYKFFSNGGIVDRRNQSEVETEKKFSKMLPRIPGKYKELDFFKLDSLKNKYRSRVFNTLNKYAESFWC
jgi:hypothetical protein